jgi:hypothetical protein
VSHNAYYEKKFKWTAQHITVSAVSGNALAVVTKAQAGSRAYLHILAPNVQELSSLCASFS